MRFVPFSYDNFDAKYAEGKPYEEEALKRILQILNDNRQPSEHYQVGTVQTKRNHSTVRYDFEIVCENRKTRD